MEPVNPFAETDESELFRLDEELVTVASRYAQTVREAPSIVSLVTADQIRERGYRTLSELLRDLPGVYVWKSPEGRDLVAFRGVVAPDNNKVLLLVDGVPWYDGVYTHAFIDEYLPIGHVRQVEVIKGPGSAIYGTNAFAGVINVVTFAPSDVEGARVRFSAGQFGRTDLTAVVGDERRVGALSTAMTAYARVFRQDGDGLDFDPEGGVNVLGEDPKRGLAVGGLLEVERLRLQVHHVDYRHTYLTRQGADDVFGVLGTDVDTTGILYHDSFVDLRYAIPLGDIATLTPILWSQRHDNPGNYGYVAGTTAEGDVSTVVVETEKDTRRFGVGLEADARFGLDHHTVAGAGIENTTVLDLRDTRFDDDSPPEGEPTGFGIGEDDRLCNAYGFAQHTWIAMPGVELVGGARADYRYGGTGCADLTAASGVRTSPRAAVLLIPSNRVTAKLLYGQAFRYANVREALVSSPYDPATLEWDFTNGNRDLAPEQIQTAEGEITARVADPIELRGDLSWSTLTNEINKLYVEPDVAAGTQGGSQYRNADARLDILAMEAEINVHADVTELRLAYAWTDARYVGGEYDGRRQYEFPPHAVKSRLAVHVTDQLSGTLLGEGYAPRPRRAWSPDARVDDGRAFGLVHLGVRMQDLGPRQRVELDVSVRNLLDTAWDTGVYRDEANEDGLVGGLEGTSRSINVAMEVEL